MPSASSPAKRLKKLAAEIPEDRITHALMRAMEDQESPLIDRSIAIIGRSKLKCQCMKNHKRMMIYAGPRDRRAAKQAEDIPPFGPIAGHPDIRSVLRPSVTTPWAMLIGLYSGMIGVSVAMYAFRIPGCSMNRLCRGGSPSSHGPHPEGGAKRRFEGWPLARSRLWPSFETRARARSSGSPFEQRPRVE